MKLDKVMPIIEGHGDFDLKATSDFAETVLADKSSNNLELTLAHNLKRAVKHLNFWVGKYSESVEEVSLEDDGAFGKCPACGYEFNSELLSEYDLKFCLNCGKKISMTVPGPEREKKEANWKNHLMDRFGRCE